MRARIRMMITEEQAESALNYLAKTDQEWAEAKARVQATDYLRKSTRAEIKLEKEAANNVRLDIAEASDTYRRVCGDHVDAIQAFALIDARRKSAELRIEVWRSENAARRRGNV